MSDTTAPEPEQILAITARHVRRLLPGFAATSGDRPGGMFVGTRDDLASLRTQAAFVLRAPAETNFALKQLIVYAVVCYNGKTLCYKRGKVGGEVRLHAKRSIGVGGHINPEDWEEGLEGASVFDQALERELLEEVGITCDHIGHIEFLGFVNEDATPVGSVHLGLVYRANLQSIEGLAFEQALVDPQWLSDSDGQVTALAGAGELEPWSALVIAGIDEPAAV